MVLTAMDPITVYEMAMHEMRTRLRGVKESQWKDPTPCSEWNVKQLTDHITGGPGRWAGMINGEPPAAPPAGSTAGPTQDPVAAYDQSTAKFLAAIKQPGALDKVFNLRGREMKVRDFVCMPGVTDTVIHTWDLAKATGQDTKLDARLTQYTYEQLAPRMPTMAGGTAFKPSIPVDGKADLQTKLIAMTGRQP